MSKWSVAKETVTVPCKQAADHGADAPAMLETLISTAISALAAERNAAYVKNPIDYEVGPINVQHVDVQRLT